MQKITLINLFFCFTLSGLATTESQALSREEQVSEKIAPSNRLAVLTLAERIGLRDDFENLSQSELDKTRKELAEARILRHLWQTEFELKHVLVKIDEERTALTLAIGRVENRQTVIANSLDSANFLSTSIIALVGNCIFIPAPPPRPKIPNILFSTANGISTGMSLLSLAALQGGKASPPRESASMLEPLFATQFNPEHSGRVWRYLNHCDEQTKRTPRQKLLESWIAADFTTSKSGSEKPELDRLYGLSADSGPIKLSRLRTRLKMLEDLQSELLKMSRILSDLGHCL